MKFFMLGFTHAIIKCVVMLIYVVASGFRSIKLVS